MAEISVLPVALSHAGADHVLSLLSEAAAEGRDLGSRVPHMRVHACTLARLAQTLDEDLRMHRDFVAAHPLTSFEAKTALDKIDRLVGEVRKLVALVETYPEAVSPS